MAAVNELDKAVAAYAGELNDFDGGEVPENLTHLIRYARVWGIPEGLERKELSDVTDQSVIEQLKRVIADNDDVLDEWLAGKEADSPTPSDAYYAFSAMRMCADFF